MASGTRAFPLPVRKRVCKLNPSRISKIAQPTGVVGGEHQMDGSQVGEGELALPGAGTGSVPSDRVNRARKPAAAKPMRPAALVWSGLLGFVAGAVCWHFVGFWGFVKEAVFHARADGAALTAARAPGASGGAISASGKGQNREPGSTLALLAARSLNCSVAVMDKAGGEVQPRSCEATAVKFHPPRNIVRADRGDFGPTPVPTLISGQGTAVSGWSARIETLDGVGVDARTQGRTGE